MGHGLIEMSDQPLNTLDGSFVCWYGHARSVVGRGHISANIPCQDSSTVGIIHQGAWAIVSDGAGSAAHSDEGSAAVIDATEDFLSDLGNWLSRSHASIATELITSIQSRLSRTAQACGYDLNSLSATLLFVAISNGQYLCGNLGDGVIGALNHEGHAELILGPERGEFANTTVFVTSSKAKERLRLISGALESYEGFALMTDGAADTLYERRTQRLAAAIPKILEWYDANPLEEVSTALDASVLPLLTSKTQDDCSLALLRKIRVDPNELNSFSAEDQQVILGSGNKIGARNRLGVLNGLVANKDISTLSTDLGLTTRTIEHHRRAIEHLLF